MGAEQFPRGTDEKEFPNHDTAGIADSLSDLLRTAEGNLELASSQRQVDAARATDGIIKAHIVELHPDLRGTDLDVAIAGEVADLLKDSHSPDVPLSGKVEAATVGVVDEMERPGGRVADELAKDPGTFTQAVKIGLRGGLDPTGLEKVVKDVIALEDGDTEAGENAGKRPVQPSAETDSVGVHESREGRINRIRARDNERDGADSGSAELWREDLFGTAEIKAYQEDIMERLRTTEQRVGEEVIIDGRERRPIMDIKLDEDSRASVKRSLEQRSQGMDRVTEILRGYVAAGKTTDRTAVEDLFYEHNVWPRSFGKVDRVGARGTVADLYIDGTDLQRYQDIDALASKVIKDDLPPIDSVRDIQSRFISLASTMFPAGAEFIHAVNPAAIGPIKESQALATRHMIKYGGFTKTNLNGGFIHMTASPKVAYEYTGGESCTVIGVPIETVMRHSPYLMLEDSYTGNGHGDNVDPKSTQEKMGGFTLHDPYGDGTPAIFRDRFATLCDATKKGQGFVKARIGHGNYDNYGFAASSDAETADRYVYPLSECRVYTMGMEDGGQFTGAHSQYDLMLRDPNPVEIDPVALQVFAPVEQIEVPFRESTLSQKYTYHDRRTLPLSLENIVASKIPNYGARLLFMSDEDPAVVAKVLEERMSADPTKTAKALIKDFYVDYVDRVGGDPTNTPQEKIDTIQSQFDVLLKLIPDEVFAAGDIRFSSEHGHSEIRRMIGTQYAEHMRKLIRSGVSVDPRWINALLPIGQEIATDDERRLRDAYDIEKVRRREESRREAGPIVFPQV